MESGLEGRNNAMRVSSTELKWSSLNGVRPRRPEQCRPARVVAQPERPVSMESGLEGRNNWMPEYRGGSGARLVSMESGLEGRNNPIRNYYDTRAYLESQWSPA